MKGPQPFRSAGNGWGKWGLSTKSPLEKRRRFVSANFKKILVNTPSIACGFCFSCRKNRSCFLRVFVCPPPKWSRKNGIYAKMLTMEERGWTI